MRASEQYVCGRCEMCALFPLCLMWTSSSECRPDLIIPHGRVCHLVACLCSFDLSCSTSAHFHLKGAQAGIWQHLVVWSHDHRYCLICRTDMHEGRPSH